MEGYDPNIGERAIIRNRIIVAAVILNIFAMFWLIPVSRAFIATLSPFISIHPWMQEPYYIAVWYKSLNESETEYLLSKAVGMMGDYPSFEHLKHHVKDTAVQIVLLKHADLDYSNISKNKIPSPDADESVVAIALLYFSAENKDEYWDQIMNILNLNITAERDRYIFDADDSELNNDQQRLKHLINNLRTQLLYYLIQVFEPSKDVDRIPDILSLSSDQDSNFRVRLTILLSELSSDKRIADALQEMAINDPDLGVRERADYALRFTRYSMRDYYYSRYVLRNQIGFVLWLMLTAAMVKGAVLLYLKLTKNLR